MAQRTYNRYSATRRDMLEDTTRFVGWALRNPVYFPRIPRVRVDSGMQFSERFKMAFWSSVLRKIRHVPFPWEDR